MNVDNSPQIRRFLNISWQEHLRRCLDLFLYFQDKVNARRIYVTHEIDSLVMSHEHCQKSQKKRISESVLRCLWKVSLEQSKSHKHISTYQTNKQTPFGITPSVCVCAIYYSLNLLSRPQMMACSTINHGILMKVWWQARLYPISLIKQIRQQVSVWVWIKSDPPKPCEITSNNVSTSLPEAMSLKIMSAVI